MAKQERRMMVAAALAAAVLAAISFMRLMAESRKSPGLFVEIISAKDVELSVGGQAGFYGPTSFWILPSSMRTEIHLVDRSRSAEVRVGSSPGKPIVEFEPPLSITGSNGFSIEAGPKGGFTFGVVPYDQEP